MRLRLIQGIPSRVRPAGAGTWIGLLPATPRRSSVLLCGAGLRREGPGSRVRTVHVATDHFLEETPLNGRHRCISCSSQLICKNVGT